MADTTPSRRSRRPRWRPWESPTADDLSRRPLRPSRDYVVGKMLFKTITVPEDTIPKDSLAAIQAKVKEYGKSGLTSRMLHCDEAESGRPGLTWLEVAPKVAKVYEDTGPLTPIRVLVSPTLCCRFQIMWPVVQTVQTIFIQSAGDAAFSNLLKQMLPDAPYVVCPGIADFSQQYSAIHRDVQGLCKICIGAAVIKYESEKCLKWHIPQNQKVLPSDRTFNMCIQCKNLDCLLTKDVAATLALTIPEKIARTLPGSHFPLTYLSPASQKVRIRRLQTERKTLSQRLKKYDDMSVSLCSEQTAELCNVVDIINGDQSIRSELDEILLEADEHKEGHGATLQDIWDADSIESGDLKLFFEDQQKNRAGRCSNKWSLITYRLALAVYTRSPAAYQALKSFNILQLPCKKSLQGFLSANQSEPGVNEEQIAEQKRLYDAHTMRKVKEEKKPPIQKGILIFDEVKVQNKVVWNSKNNKIIGLAMTADHLWSLHDIFHGLDDDFRTKKTTYVLQFMWRDLSSSFDAIGPYFTAERSVETKFLVSCLFESMFVLETYGFQVYGLVCDGASCNLSLLKHLCGTSGQYGTDEDEGVTIVPSSFSNPYSGHSVHLIICPSHQLKNMISALHSSRPRGTKDFCKDGVCFGWLTIVETWERDLKRIASGSLSNLPGMQQRYITRDSWTKLNVKPAKIMQDRVIEELTSHCQPPLTASKQRDQQTLNYLLALNKIFERGILSNGAVRSSEAKELALMKEGLEFFESWCLDVIANGVNPNENQQKSFFAWQTWDLLRVMYNGFVGLCTSFLAENPDYFIIPVRVNGSAVESYFSQLKFSAGGQLSSVNYATAQASVETTKAAAIKRPREADYRDAGLDIHPVQLKKT